jgi:thiol-disulfide isomerase/thioredoxin
LDSADDPSIVGLYKIYRIPLNPHIRKSLLPEELEGNWLNADGSNLWVAGLYEDKAVYDCHVWQYTSIGKKGKTTVISLKSGPLVNTLYVKKVNKKCFKIGEEKKAGPVCSLTPVEELKAVTADADKPFDQLLQKKDTAIYSGYIKNYTPLMKNIVGSVNVNDVLCGEQSFPVKIHSDGTFETRLPLYYPCDVKLKLLGVSYCAFLEPGKQLFQLVDKEKMNGEDNEGLGVYFMGPSASLNVELNRSGLENYVYSDTLAKLFPKMTIPQYIDSAQVDYARESVKLEAYKTNNQLSKKAVQVLDNRLEMRRAFFLMSYGIYAFYNTPKKNKEAVAMELFNNQNLTDSANGLVRNVLLDSLSIVNYNYLKLICRVQLTDLSNDSTRIKAINFNYNMIKELYNLIQKKKGLTPEELKTKNVLDRYSNMFEIKDTTILSEINPAINTMVMKYLTDVETALRNCYYNYLQTNLGNFIGKKNDLLPLMMANSYLLDKGGLMPMSEEEIADIRKDITNPALLNMILGKNEELKAAIRNNKKKTGYNVNATPTVENSKLFEAILEKYKGKVVLVDFWATWCAPCKAGIKNIAPLKEEMADENIVFVYLTDESSPLETWQNMIQNIRGEQFRLSKDQWEAMFKRFNIVGIPRYILVNKKGDVVDKNLIFASIADLKSILEKQLGE